MNNASTSLKIKTRFSKNKFSGVGLIFPLLLSFQHWKKITSFYLHKHGQVLSKTCFQGVVPPDLPPEGSRLGVSVRKSKTYSKGSPTPRNRFLVIPSHFKNMIRICQKPVFRGWYPLIYPLQEVNQRVLPP